ncbi:MAG: ParB/RepB/Spo0J family partition protein, partial [Burkholderiaceae bacterium]
MTMATDQHDTVTAALPSAGAGPLMRMVELALIEESLTNPRKHFDQAKLAELAETIKDTGVLQPILLRPLPGERVPDTFGFRRQGAPLPAYELVSGARRFRASRIAGLAEIPAMIRELTDSQARHIQHIENIQREDVSAMEEAESFQSLMDDFGMTADDIGAKIKQSRSYVYGRLKLLALCPKAREALSQGEIDASRALRIARIPVAKMQEKALAEAARKNHRGDFAVGVREFEDWLQKNVMLRLEQAPFPIEAEDLVPGAGSCKACPSRTGANPDLWDDVQSPDLCTDPSCHAKKVQAHGDAMRALAEAKGMRVIEGKEAKEIVSQHSWDGYGHDLKGFTRLDCIKADASQDGKQASLRELLGDSGPKAVLIEDPYNKELIEAVPTDEAEAVLVQRGVVKNTQRKINVEERIGILKQQSTVRQQRAASTALYAAFMNSAHASAAPAKVLADAELLREWLKLQVLDLDTEDLCAVARIDPIEDEEYSATEARAIARLDRAKDSEVRGCMLAWLLSFHSYRYGDGKGQGLLSAACRALGIDADAVTAEAVATEKADLKEAIANVRAAAKAQAEAEQAAAPKPASTPPPAAQATPTRAKSKKSSDPAALARDSARGKTTKAQASADIAA